MAVTSIKSRKSLSEENDNASSDCSLKEGLGRNAENFGVGSSAFKKRPLNLQDFIVGEENLVCDSTKANFSLGDISESEEIWIFDVPKTINPKNFKGQTMRLGKKNHFQIRNELYESSSITSNHKQHLSFVFNTGRRKQPYKTVNVKPAGSVRIRQKLSSVLDANLVSPEKVCVPFPKNLELRHPLFGRNYNEKLITVAK